VRVFILYANPVATSFGAALHQQVVATLQSRGHEVDDCDLYLESFDPIMSTEERIAYRDTATSRARVPPYADRLLAAEAPRRDVSSSDFSARCLGMARSATISPTTI
jgi:NAD(P)H dehydrogenase (quinone)